jgi:hypothetical protein
MVMVQLIDSFGRSFLKSARWWVPAGCALVIACSGESERGDGNAGGGGYRARDAGPEEPNEFGNRGDGGAPPQYVSDGSTPDAAGPSIIASLRIDPKDAVLELAAGEEGTQDYRVFATLEGASTEIDITDRTVFYVPDNWRVGSFADNGPKFATSATEPRGGTLTVQASAASTDGTIEKIETSLTVLYRSAPVDPRDDGSGAFDVPSDAASLFDGSEDALRAPRLVYPNDGVLLPPNLQRLAVHFEAGSPDNTLFEVSFDTQGVELRYYVRCGEQVDGGCILELDAASFKLLADSSREGQTVKLRVRGTNDAGQAVGRSVEQTLSFARTDVRGALYYWRTSNPEGIMRADFGAADIDPEPFLLEDDPRLSRTTYMDSSSGDIACVGCHTLSRDGSRIIASQGGQNDGYQVYIKNLAMDPLDTRFITVNGDDENRIQFASFSPDAETFVSVFGDTDDISARHTLWFHDGDNGARKPADSIELPWEPDHPEWSPDGEMIALTRVGIHRTSQRPRKSGIELLRRDATGPNKGWSAPVTVVPIADGLNRYNASFVPDSSLFVFSESTCPGGAGEEDSGDCDADTDPSAKTWAVVPELDAAPVLLARAAAGGVRDDGATDLTDTFPRSAPFDSEYDDTAVYWVTVSSKRRAGLYNDSHRQLLWMFAIDPAKIKDGEDGSYPAFFLPFQDLDTSNHIGQWTSQVVTDEPPPPPPDPPDAPPPPPAPPPVVD